MRTHLLAAVTAVALPLLTVAHAFAPAAPGSANPHAKAAPSPWAEMADFTLTVKVPPKGESGTWKFRTFADPADMIVELDTPAAKGRTKGTIMLVSGQGIAVKGYTPEAGFEVDPLDISIVNLKVLTQLLDAAAPKGPESVTGRTAVNVRELKSPIIAQTPTANASFLPPWSLKGTVERVDGKITFNLELDVPNGDKPAERAKWHYSGTASGATKGRVLEDGTSLAGWTAYNLAPKDPKGTHSLLRFGATKLDGPFATVKDLRAALARIPAPAAPTKPMPAKKP